jgi:hypothetical protein
MRKYIHANTTNSAFVTSPSRHSIHAYMHTYSENIYPVFNLPQLLLLKKRTNIKRILTNVTFSRRTYTGTYTYKYINTAKREYTYIHTHTCTSACFSGLLSSVDVSERALFFFDPEIIRRVCQEPDVSTRQPER